MSLAAFNVQVSHISPRGAKHFTSVVFQRAIQKRGPDPWAAKFQTLVDPDYYSSPVVHRETIFDALEDNTVGRGRNGRRTQPRKGAQ